MRPELRSLMVQRFWQLLWIAGMLVIIASNAYWIGHNQLNGDVAIYISAGERLADGAVLYRDVNDVNPPLVFLLQMPSTYIARALHLMPHVIWYIDVWLAYCVILLFCGWLCKGLIPAAWILPLLFFASFQIGINDRRQFSQRDQLAVVAFLPFFLCCARRMAEKPAGRTWTFLASLSAGLGVALKPYFLLPWFVLVVVTSIWPDLNWRRLLNLKNSLEFWVVIAVQAAQGLLVVIFFPRFIPSARIAALYYGAANTTLRVFIPLWPYVLTLAVIGFVFVKYLRSEQGHKYGGTELIAAGVLSAYGFLTEAIIQRKGLPYHLIPFFLFYWSVIAVALVMILETRFRAALPSRILTIPLTIVSLAFVVVSVSTAREVDPPIYPEALRAAIQNDRRPGPVMFVAADPWCTFPVVYESRQQLAQRDPNLWAIPGFYRDQIKEPNGHFQPPHDARYHSLKEMSEDEKMLFGDLRNALALKPRLIYVQTGPKQSLGNLRFDYLQYLSVDPEMARELKQYSASLGDVAGPHCEPRCFTLLVRQDRK